MTTPIRNAAEKLYAAGCGHVMEVDEIEAIIDTELAAAAKVATGEGELIKVVRSKDVMEALCAVFDSVKGQTLPVSQVGFLVYKGLLPVPEFYVTVSPTPEDSD